MVDGVSDAKVMELMNLPLSDQEEAILSLLQKVNRLEYENQNLIEEVKRLRWSMQEHD